MNTDRSMCTVNLNEQFLCTSTFATYSIVLETCMIETN